MAITDIGYLFHRTWLLLALHYVRLAQCSLAAFYADFEQRSWSAVCSLQAAGCRLQLAVCCRFSAGGRLFQLRLPVSLAAKAQQLHAIIVSRLAARSVNSARWQASLPASSTGRPAGQPTRYSWLQSLVRRDDTRPPRQLELPPQPRKQPAPLACGQQQQQQTGLRTGWRRRRQKQAEYKGFGRFAS